LATTANTSRSGPYTGGKSAGADFPHHAEICQKPLDVTAHAGGMVYERNGELLVLAVVILCSLSMSIIAIKWDYMYLAIVALCYLTGSVFATLFIVLCDEE
jgi:hypothetical protein